MPLSCHGAVNELRGDTDYVFALAGNPNVGKSSMFNAFTGTGVVTANYPGKTVEINVATTRLGDLKIGLVDLPGTYALGAVSEDQWVARQGLLDGKPDAVIVILDATNLSRNLYMLLQLLDMGFPTVAALNLSDQARKMGIDIDDSKLSRILGIPVIPTVATRGEGLDLLLAAAASVAQERCEHPEQRNRRQLQYGSDIEDVVTALAADVERLLGEETFGVSPEGLALLLLENDKQFVELVREASPAPGTAGVSGASGAPSVSPGAPPKGNGHRRRHRHRRGRPGGAELLEKVRSASEAIEAEHGEQTPLRIIRERHGLAGSIAAEVQRQTHEHELFSQRMWHFTTAPATGIPLLIGVLGFVFAFLFIVGEFLSEAFSSLWAATLSPLIQGAIHAVFGEGVVAKILIWGPDAGIEAALAVGIPYVLTFYFLLAFLEDSGYLNSVAFLTDRIMHKLGLHGRSVIPLVAGAGCNVPAIIGTRVLTTKRERTIASTLIVLVPCSARTAVILGAVAGFAGWQWAIGVFAIVAALIFVVGLGLNKVLPGESTGLVMEMFPFRMPSLKSIAIKTWFRFKDFIFVATPIVLGGSLLLGLLYETGWIWALAAPLSPIVEGWLGLPSVAGLTLIFAVLRKELALQLLVTMAVVQYGPDASNLLNIMNPGQLFVYALVSTIYVPCVATIAVLGKELGWKRSAAIVTFTTALAVLIGGIAHRVILAVG